MNGFVGVHIGAGSHSESLTKDYKKLCHAACRQGTAVLLSGGSTLDAVTSATMVLEASVLTNAGFGSNLNHDGNVEVDAGVMEGERLAFGGVGAVPGMCHPVIVATEICKAQYRGSLTPAGLVAPSLIVGSGAAKWAEKAGLSRALSTSLISDRAKKQYLHNKRKLEGCARELISEESVGLTSALDTVGAVAIDSHGHVSAACSSGGISLKQCGRVGQAAMFGAGCWAENGDAMGHEGELEESVAACTTGCGEYIIRTGLARELAYSVRLSEDSAIVPLHSAFTKKFLKSPLLRHVDERGRLGGAIVLRGIGPRDHLEFLWGHSTKSMCIGYMPANTDSKPKCRISRLPNGSEEGQKVVVEGISFDMNCK